MPAKRLAPPRRKVTITLDGERLEADEGEPIAHALVASDRIALARSPKLHRPRGPCCMRGGCDGCLMRVDGVPNVMTCLAPAKEGTRVETQNVVGTRTVDLLRVTDWFFPHGMDHHHFMAGIPGVSPIVQAIARRVAGLGILPDAVRQKATGTRREIDALVVGGGASGIAAASALAKKGVATILVDDQLALGGSLRALGKSALDRILASYPLAGVDVRLQTVAAGVYERDVLLASHEKSEVVRPKILILAPGRHDGVHAFEGNDLPGVYSARAAALLAQRGVSIGDRIVLAGKGPYADALVEALGGKSQLTRVDLASLRAAEGSSRVGAVLVQERDGERKLRADALAVELPGAPAFELAEQAGAAAHWRSPEGFAPDATETDPIAPGTWAVGDVVTPQPAGFDAIAQGAARIAAAAADAATVRS